MELTTLRLDVEWQTRINKELTAELAAMTAARDEACRSIDIDRLTELRKVGDE